MQGEPCGLASGDGEERGRETHREKQGDREERGREKRKERREGKGRERETEGETKRERRDTERKGGTEEREGRSGREMASSPRYPCLGSRLREGRLCAGEEASSGEL